MSKKEMSKKLKRSALIVNLLQVAALIFFEIVIYRLFSYQDYIFLQYIPVKYLVILQVILLVVTIVPFIIKRGKKRTIISMFISFMLIICLVTVSVFCLVYDKQLKNVVVKADQTIDKMVENSQLATDEYGVYVLKTDPAETILDAKDYSFGYNATYSIEDVNTVISAIQTEVSQDIDLVQINDPAKLADKLMNGKVKAIILNQTMIDLIEDVADESGNDENNVKYAEFVDNIKCIYTVDIKSELANLKDNGGVTTRCFNIYISGIDTEGDVTARSRSDVNIIMSVNPITHEILLVSTPRDFYVPLSISNGVKDKLTHAGNYGIDVSMETLEMLYGIEIDYFVRMNFTGFENIIDALGGIDVVSEQAFSTHGYSYNEGLNANLSGIEALWFARERKSFAGGDRQRGSNQMKVIEAVIEKCQSSALLRNYDEILNDISESFQTNMSKDSIRELVKFQLNNAPDWEVISYSVTGTGQSNYTYSVPSARAYVMEPDQATVDKAKQLFEDNKYNKELVIQEETTTSSY